MLFISYSVPEIIENNLTENYKNSIIFSRFFLDEAPQFSHRHVVVQRPRDVHTEFEMLEEIGRYVGYSYQISKVTTAIAYQWLSNTGSYILTVFSQL